MVGEGRSGQRDGDPGTAARPELRRSPKVAAAGTQSSRSSGPAGAGQRGAGMTLLPGDVLLTGTPAGVGPMVAGQTVSVTVEGIGTLTNPVAARQ